MDTIKVRVKKVHQLDRGLFPEGTETFITRSETTGKWVIKSKENGLMYNIDDLTARISNRCSYSDILTKI